jgi:N-acetyl-gamma-glutamylphosphate reductase
MFDFTPVGVVVAVVGVAFVVLIGWRLVPKNRRGRQSADEAFQIRDYTSELRIGAEGVLPNIAYVRGANYCDIGVVVDPRTNRVIVVSAIDNLVKGAAGQAVQSMNLLFGLPETRGLEVVPLFP